jgi:hypothetical protein
MKPTDVIAAIGEFSAAFAMIAAFIAIWITVRQYKQNQIQQQKDQRKELIRQQAAQTREDLQAIIGDCNQFLRPLSQNIPYPVLHTVTAIVQQFCERVCKYPRQEQIQAVEALLGNSEILLSICVEGWINSSQILHMVEMAEELEHKAFSHNLQGKLMFISHASFLLAGIVAQICSPESFHKLLQERHRGIVSELEKLCKQEPTILNILDIVSIVLQNDICGQFNEYYHEAIINSLYIIQTAAVIFIDLEDEKLNEFTKIHQAMAPNFIEARKLCNRFEEVKSGVKELEKDKKICINPNLQVLQELICSEAIEKVIGEADTNRKSAIIFGRNM